MICQNNDKCDIRIVPLVYYTVNYLSQKKSSSWSQYTSHVFICVYWETASKGGVCIKQRQFGFISPIVTNTSSFLDWLKIKICKLTWIKLMGNPCSLIFLCRFTNSSLVEKPVFIFGSRVDKIYLSNRSEHIRLFP